MANKSNETVGASEKKSLVRLVSRLNYPVTLKYNGDNIVIAPQGTAVDIDPAKLESTLPTGIQSVAYLA